MTATAPTPVQFVRPHRKRRETGAVWIQMAVALLAGVSFFLLVALVLSMGYRLVYFGRIFPGVSVAGVNVSGMSRDSAALKIQAALTFPYTGRIVFRDGKNVSVETPAQLGMVLDPASTAQLAYDFGRKGGLFQTINDQLNAAQVGVALSPVVVFDQRIAYSFLQNFALQVNKPVVEASLVINGLDVSSQPGQVGRILNTEATLVYVHAQMQSFRDGEIPLVIQEQAPQVMDASAQVAAARNLLAAPLTFSIPDAHTGDPGPWQIQPAELAPMLRVGRLNTGSGAQYVVQIDRTMLQSLLGNISKQVDRPEADARFTFDEQTSQLTSIQASVIGLQVDIPGSMDEIEKAVATGQQSAFLRVNVTQPQVADTATGQQLGITQLISSETTYFYGSSAARLNNIQTASSKFHGLLVAPGETFSMGQYMGDVSLDSGYAEALIIYNGKTIKGVGGGVCQVSTTLFRTVFFAGFPVVERHAHAYRVYYYEQRPGGSNDPTLSGFDATVYFPLVDFKFKNDTPYWLLMDTFFDRATYSLTWKFYSTSDGRTVQWDTTGPTNIVPAPPPVVTFNPDLGPDEQLKHVDYAADGADVTISRQVMRDGKIAFVDKFVTQYQPWAEACQYGPDIKDPEKSLKKKGWCQIP
jgi:vancomycin resistance protein YoaR